MTIEGAKKHLELITAFANGETIQYLASDGEWYDHAEPMFVEHRKYRVKPKRVFALYNKMTRNIQYQSDTESNFLQPSGWIKVELVQSND